MVTRQIAGPGVTIDMLFGNTPTVAQGPTISLGYGKANFSNTSASYAAMKCSAPFIRVSGVTSGKAHGRQNWTQVGQYEVSGGFSRANVEHSHGSVILLQASWKRRGAPIRDGALFLRLRVGAPLWQIDAKLPLEEENTYGEKFNMFRGYADIMNAEELRLIGIQVNRSYTDNFMLEEQIDECFELQQLEQERVPRPTISAISTPTGVELREVLQAPARRINIRRSK